MKIIWLLLLNQLLIISPNVKSEPLQDSCNYSGFRNSLIEVKKYTKDSYDTDFIYIAEKLQSRKKYRKKLISLNIDQSACMFLTEHYKKTIFLIDDNIFKVNDITITNELFEPSDSCVPLEKEVLLKKTDCIVHIVTSTTMTTPTQESSTQTTSSLSSSTPRATTTPGITTTYDDNTSIPVSSSSKEEKNQNLESFEIAGIVLGSLVIVVSIIIFLLILVKRRRNAKGNIKMIVENGEKDAELEYEIENVPLEILKNNQDYCSEQNLSDLDIDKVKNEIYYKDSLKSSSSSSLPEKLRRSPRKRRSSVKF